MKPHEAKPGMSVRSISDGFTSGWSGTIDSIAMHPSHPPAAFVKWDNGFDSAVAIDLIHEDGKPS